MRFTSVFIVLSLLGACAAPRGAAIQSQIVKESQAENASYDVVPVTKASLAQVSAWPATGSGLSLSWPGKGQSQASRVLRRGDVIGLTIWENQANSLLAVPEQRAVPIKGLVISPDGTIFVPYIDAVKVAGLSPEAARATIQERLAPIAPSAQVQLDVTPGEQNAIDVVSGVLKPGRYPVATHNVTVLSMLAEAGGIPDPLRNPVVRLQRSGTAYAALASDLYHNPAKDILLRSGDRLLVESDPRSFVVLGAAGAERTVHFEKASHSLLEALSLSNGLAEARSNIRGIMVLRQYPRKAVRTDGSGPGKDHVIFSFDLATGDGLFAANSFKVNPDDVVLATESPLPPAANILGLFGATLGIAQRVEGL